MKSILLGTLLFLAIYSVIWFFNKRRMEKQAAQHATTKPINHPRKLKNRRKK